MHKEEGHRCEINGCDGELGYEPVENCSCHLSAPCWGCVHNPLVCLECGERHDEPISYTDKPITTPIVDIFTPRPLDNTKIDFRSKSHSSCSMIIEGVYPSGTTEEQVLSQVEGTFGGKFEHFGDGRFKYIAYTD